MMPGESPAAPQLVFLPGFDGAPALGDLVIPERARGELRAVCHNAAIVEIAGPHFALEVQPDECAQAVLAQLRNHFPALQRQAA
jgi:hypothetical protein